MAEITKPILLDETGQAIRAAILEVRDAVLNQGGGGYTEDDLQAKYDEGLQVGQASADSILSNVDIGDYYNASVTKLGTFALYYRSTLKTLNLPNMTDGASGCVSQCTNLTEVRLPSLRTIESGTWFANCSKLALADLGAAIQLSTSTFSNCSVLKTLILRRQGTAGTALPALNAFNGTPYAEGGSGGKVYVPSAMIEWYKSATNWSVLYGYGTVEFLQLEGSEYE